MNDCLRIGKLFGGCRFEPRYDKSAADLSASKIDVQGRGAIEALRHITYVRDVCIRCGRTIERTK